MTTTRLSASATRSASCVLGLLVTFTERPRSNFDQHVIGSRKGPQEMFVDAHACCEGIRGNFDGSADDGGRWIKQRVHQHRLVEGLRPIECGQRCGAGVVVFRLQTPNGGVDIAPVAGDRDVTTRRGGWGLG